MSETPVVLSRFAAVEGLLSFEHQQKEYSLSVLNEQPTFTTFRELVKSSGSRHARYFKTPFHFSLALTLRALTEKPETGDPIRYTFLPSFLARLWTENEDHFRQPLRKAHLLRKLLLECGIGGVLVWRHAASLPDENMHLLLWQFTFRRGPQSVSLDVVKDLAKRVDDISATSLPWFCMELVHAQPRAIAQLRRLAQTANDLPYATVIDAALMSNNVDVVKALVSGTVLTNQLRGSPFEYALRSTPPKNVTMSREVLLACFQAPDPQRTSLMRHTYVNQLIEESDILIELFPDVDDESIAMHVTALLRACNVAVFRVHWSLLINHAMRLHTLWPAVAWSDARCREFFQFLFQTEPDGQIDAYIDKKLSESLLQANFPDYTTIDSDRYPLLFVTSLTRDGDIADEIVDENLESLDDDIVKRMLLTAPPSRARVRLIMKRQLLVSKQYIQSICGSDVYTPLVIEYIQELDILNFVVYVPRVYHVYDAIHAEFARRDQRALARTAVARVRAQMRQYARAAVYITPFNGNERMPADLVNALMILSVSDATVARVMEQWIGLDGKRRRDDVSSDEEVDE